MSQRAIFNALLRIEKVWGAPPFPFERPNAKMRFWVLELAVEQNSFGKGILQMARILRKHTVLLRELHRKRATLTLFIETSGGSEPLRLEAGLLKLISELELSLEIFNS